MTREERIEAERQDLADLIKAADEARRAARERMRREANAMLAMLEKGEGR